jgi:hypothetical protein
LRITHVRVISMVFLDFLVFRNSHKGLWAFFMMDLRKYMMIYRDLNGQAPRYLCDRVQVWFRIITRRIKRQNIKFFEKNTTEIFLKIFIMLV